MFASNSRYYKQPIYVATTATGQQFPAVVPPLPPTATPALAGFYPRQFGDRLDLIAARFLADPTTFWRLCDANNIPVPDALANRPIVGIPK